MDGAGLKTHTFYSVSPYGLIFQDPACCPFLYSINVNDYSK